MLCVIAVTSALHPLSLHRPRSSPLFTSQQRTSSSAPTIARPAPVDRESVLGAISSGLQTTFDEADVMRPNVFECSYFLSSSVLCDGRGNGETHLQVGLHHLSMGSLFCSEAPTHRNFFGSHRRQPTTSAGCGALSL